MRVALISDLHANAIALEAVLADAARVGVDEVICLGDVATLGPRPHEVISILKDRNIRCIIGNHDAFMLDAQLIHTYSEVPIVVEAVDWCRERLSQDELDFIATFQPTLELTLDQRSTLFLFHGTPRSHMEDMLATTPPEVVDEMLNGHQATAMAGGHTHLQMLRQHRGILLINPGSVGMPFREAIRDGKPPDILDHAEYATVEGNSGSVSVTLRRVPLDRSALRSASEASDNPLCAQLVEQYS